MVDVDDTAQPGVYEAAFEPADVSVSQHVVEAVASFQDADPTDLERLYDAVDPDALDSIFATDEPPRGATELTFQYEGLDVSVVEDGTIRLQDST